jgi:ech hydrogenase subunit B
MTTFIGLILGLFVAPVLGGFISGVDRRVTARFQSRFGPPLAQPFYDVAKLLGKETNYVNIWIGLCSYIYVAAAAISCTLFFMQADLLLIFFVQAIGAVFLVVGALSVPSPYSQIGGQRELLQMLAYEPILILVIVGIYLTTGSFKVSAVFAHETPLLIELPLLFVALGYALTVKLRKSPFDISGCHHAHQELVRGVYTEYSGVNMAMVEIAHWYEVVLILGLVSLFWATNIFGMILLVAGAYFVEILVDNASARMSWRWMLGKIWAAGLTLCIVNLIWIYAGRAA